jgi:hypothetical protein
MSSIEGRLALRPWHTSSEAEFLPVSRRLPRRTAARSAYGRRGPDEEGGEQTREEPTKKQKKDQHEAWIVVSI